MNGQTLSITAMAAEAKETFDKHFPKFPPSSYIEWWYALNNSTVPQKHELIFIVSENGFRIRGILVGDGVSTIDTIYRNSIWYRKVFTWIYDKLNLDKYIR